MKVNPLITLYVWATMLHDGMSNKITASITEGRENPERGDGGPIPTAVIIAAVLTAAIALGVIIANAVTNHSASIN
jgi:hypothetical protein